MFDKAMVQISMRDLAWVAVAAGVWVAACSGTDPAEGGRGSDAESGASGVIGGACDDDFAGAGGLTGASGWSGDAGSGGATESDYTLSLWHCHDQMGDESSGGRDAVAPSDFPSTFPPFTAVPLAQLVGIWVYKENVNDPNPYGYFDYFSIEADGTGSQATKFLYDTPDEEVLTYAGTMALASERTHVIALDSTAGTHDFFSYSLGHDYSTHETLPDQTVRYGYGFDATTDTLYLNTARCRVPLPFKRQER